MGGLALDLGLSLGGSAALTDAPLPAVVAYANFALPSATGNFTISTSDLGGLTPKMAVFALSNAEASETSFAAPAGEEAFHMFGAADGTNQWAVTSSTEGGTNNDWRKVTASGCMLGIDESGVTLMEGAFTSFDANGVTVNITTLSADLYGKRGFVMFFAGSDCSVEVGNIAGDASGASTKAIGFTPDGMLFSELYGGSMTSSATTAIQTFGFAVNDGSATQYNGARYLATGSGSGRVNDKAAGYGASSVPTCTISFSGADVTATWSSAISLALPYAAWSFNGSLSAVAGTITSPTSATTATATGLGMTPTSALFITGPGAVNTTITGGGFGAGWLTATGGGSMGCQSKTGYCSTTRLNIADGADIAALDSFASGSITLDFTTADANARLLPFIAFGT